MRRIFRVGSVLLFVALLTWQPVSLFAQADAELEYSESDIEQERDEYRQSLQRAIMERLLQRSRQDVYDQLQHYEERQQESQEVYRPRAARIEESAPVDDPEDVSGTGEIITPVDLFQEQIDLLNHDMEMRRTRAEDFLSTTQSDTERLFSFQTESNERLQQKRDHLVECRSEIRRANRDTLLRTVLRCYRGQLTQDLEQLRKLQLHLGALPGITDATREQTLEALAELIESIAAVVDAIDIDVYTSIGVLEATKSNLYEKYRIPLWNNLVHVRAEHVLSWLAHLIVNTEELTESDQLTSWKVCVLHSERALNQISTEEDYKESNSLLSQALIDIKSCNKSVLDPGATPFPAAEEPVEPELERPTESTEETSGGSGSLLVLPRRLQRHLR